MQTQGNNSSGANFEHVSRHVNKHFAMVWFLHKLTNIIIEMNIGESGCSCYNFHVLKHILCKRKEQHSYNFFHEARISLLMKISDNFDIRVNIFKVLRNKQTQDNCNNLPQGRGKLLHHMGVSCYTLFNSTISTVWPSQTWNNVYMCLPGYVGVFMYQCVCLFVCLCVLFCSFVRALNVDENDAH